MAGGQTHRLSACPCSWSHMQIIRPQTNPSHTLQPCLWLHGYCGSWTAPEMFRLSKHWCFSLVFCLGKNKLKENNMYILLANNFLFAWGVCPSTRSSWEFVFNFFFSFKQIFDFCSLFLTRFLFFLNFFSLKGAKNK